MDEPTAGLDPRQCERFAALLAEIADDVHVVVSTHQVADVVDLYSSVVVLDSGVVKFQGSAQEFAALGAGHERRTHAAYATLVTEEE